MLTFLIQKVLLIKPTNKFIILETIISFPKGFDSANNNVATTRTLYDMLKTSSFHKNIHYILILKSNYVSTQKRKKSSFELLTFRWCT